MFLCCSDSGSGISDVSLGLGLGPSDTSVLDWTRVAATSSGPVTVSVDVPDGVWSYVKIRATDRGTYTGWCVCVRAYVRVCVHVCACVYIRMCVHRYVFVHMCM